MVLYKKIPTSVTLKKKGIDFSYPNFSETQLVRKWTNLSILEALNLPSTKIILEKLQSYIQEIDQQKKTEKGKVYRLEHSRKRIIQKITGIKETRRSHLLTHARNTNVYAQAQLQEYLYENCSWIDMKQTHLCTLSRATWIVALFHDLLEETILSESEIKTFFRKYWLPTILESKIRWEFHRVDIIKLIKKVNESHDYLDKAEQKTQYLKEILGIQNISLAEHLILTAVHAWDTTDNTMYKKESQQIISSIQPEKIQQISNYFYTNTDRNTYKYDLTLNLQKESPLYTRKAISSRVESK